MTFTPAVAWVYGSLLLSLRISPVFALAPPFSLVRVPLLFRVLLGLGLAACLIGSNPAPAFVTKPALPEVTLIAARELLVGMTFVAALQLAFGALYLAGRTIDIQAGFGFALLVDPSSRSQTPLIGTLFAYAAGSVFMAMNGHLELLHVLRASLEAVPLGTGQLPIQLDSLFTLVSSVFLMAFGVGGGVILTMFVADLAVAMLSRTAPQMNVLVFGFQVKTILLLLVLPLSLGVTGALLVRLMSFTIAALPGLMHS